jgi:hypothetical protein
VLAELAAHQAPLQALAWSCDGALLASASAQGTVIRVHRLPSANKVGDKDSHRDVLECYYMHWPALPQTMCAIKYGTNSCLGDQYKFAPC